MPIVPLPFMFPYSTSCSLLSWVEVGVGMAVEVMYLVVELMVEMVVVEVDGSESGVCC